MENEILDNILENQDRKATETNQLLENVLENGDDNAKKLQKKTEEGSEKLSEAIKELKPAINAAGFIEGFLKEIKGDKGDNIKGDKGESIKGDKGDSVKGDKGNDGEKGEKGDTVKGEDGKDGSDGIDGSDGKNGTDGEKGKDGRDADIKEVIKILEKRKISYKDLKDIPTLYKKGAGGGTGYLREVTDVEVLDEPANGQALVYDSTKKQWKPTTLSSSTTNVYSETPTGTINGSNKVFTLANTPTTDSLQLYLNGAFQTGGGEDYTIVGDTITFINAPLSTSVLKAFYNY